MIDVNKLENKKNAPDKIIARCPACFADGKDSTGNHLAVFKNGKFGCVIDDSKEHRDLILKLVGLDANAEAYESKYVEPIPEVERIFPEAILSELVKDYTYYSNKGIKDKILEELKSGVALKGNMNGRYVFPIYTQDGRIHGFSGRTLIGAQIKWKHMGLKTNWVYPAKFVLQDIRREKEIILVESIGDLISLMSAGIRNVMVLFGVNLHKSLLSFLIAENPNKIIIATNNDIDHQVGQNASERIANKLMNYFSSDKIQINLPTKKDFGLMSEEEIITWRTK